MIINYKNKLLLLKEEFKNKLNEEGFNKKLNFYSKEKEILSKRIEQIKSEIS